MPRQRDVYANEMDSRLAQPAHFQNRAVSNEQLCCRAHVKRFKIEGAWSGVKEREHLAGACGSLACSTASPRRA